MDSKKQALLEKFLSHATFEGWKNQALEHAATDLAHPSSMAYIVFPLGIKEATDAFHTHINQQMLHLLEKQTLEALKIRERIAAAVMARLECYKPHREAIPKLLAYYASPIHAFQAAKHLSETVSLMWYAAGDKAADFNYYTKRILLAGVYSSTLLYWLQDTSEDYSDTKSFLTRRIADVMQIQKAKGALNEKLDIDQLIGLLPKPPKPISLKAMEKAVRKRAVEEAEK